MKADESVMTEGGLPDPEKVMPVSFMPGTRDYFGLGKKLARAFSVGKELLG